MSYDRKLMIPGPVDITEAVRDAMAAPTRPHYGEDWLQFYGETQVLARKLFGTQNDLFIMPGPGTMALEAALASALEPGSKVLATNPGFFASCLSSLLP